MAIGKAKVVDRGVDGYCYCCCWSRSSFVVCGQSCLYSARIPCFCLEGKGDWLRFRCGSGIFRRTADEDCADDNSDEDDDDDDEVCSKSEVGGSNDPAAVGTRPRIDVVVDIAADAAADADIVGHLCSDDESAAAAAVELWHQHCCDSPPPLSTRLWLL